MPQPPEDFADLLARARQGDQIALAKLIKQYEPDLRLAARVRLGPALRPYLDSMDLVQSVHHSLVVGLRENKFEFHNVKDMLALAVTLVQRKIARHWRRMQRQQRNSGLAEGKKDVAELLVGLAGPDDDPATTAQFHDQIQHLCRNLMDDTDRRLIELRLEGCTTAEAAREMGLREDGLRVRLQRLRQRLREHGVSPDCL